MSQQSVDSSNNSLNIGTLLQLIPEFNTDQPGNIYRFIRSCDAAFKLANPDQENILFVYALNKISGIGAPDVHSRRHDNWDTLKGFLINRFSNVKTISHLMLELQSSFQKPNESITEYFHRIDLSRSKIIEKLNAEISDDSLSGRKKCAEETALSVFINGLSSDMGSMLRTRDFKSLNEVGRFAMQEDKIRKMNIARQSLFKNYPQRLPPRPAYTPVVRTTSRNITNPNQSLSPITRSFTRPVSGFISSTYDPNKTCNYCKKVGHVISECRKRIYNNSINQQKPTTSTNVPINNLNSIAVNDEGNSLTDIVAHEQIATEMEELQISSDL